MSSAVEYQAARAQSVARPRRDQDHVFWFWPVLSSVFSIALLAWLNAYPQWVGVIRSLDDPTTFVPVLGPGFQHILPWINAALYLGLALNVLLLTQGRWNLASRWVDLGLNALSCYIFRLLATGSSILDPNAEWNAGQPLLQIGPLALSPLEAVLHVLFWVVFWIALVGAVVKLTGLVFRTAAYFTVRPGS